MGSVLTPCRVGHIFLLLQGELGLVVAPRTAGSARADYQVGVAVLG